MLSSRALANRLKADFKPIVRLYAHARAHTHTDTDTGKEGKKAGRTDATLQAEPGGRMGVT